MSGDEQVHDWKDPDGRDEPTDDHPSGRIALGRRLTIGVRAALLAGMVFGLEAAAGIGTGGTISTCVPTGPPTGGAC